MTEAGFDMLPGAHPIVPVMIGDAARAARIADAMLAEGVYVIAFSYPVVPRDRARIRVQLSAAHTPTTCGRACRLRRRPRRLSAGATGIAPERGGRAAG